MRSPIPCVAEKPEWNYILRSFTNKHISEFIYDNIFSFFWRFPQIVNAREMHKGLAKMEAEED